MPKARPMALRSWNILARRVGVVGELLYADVLEPGLRLVGIAGVDIDRDDLESRPAEPLLQRVERRHFLAAGHAPGGPQVEQHGAPAPIASVSGLPAASWKARSGTFSGLLATLTAATSPRANGAIFLANSTAGRQAGVAARIARQGRNPVYPRQPDGDSGDAARQDHGERVFWRQLDCGRSVMIGELRWICHEQQDVGWAVCVWPRRHHGGDQRLHRFRPASLPPGHRRVQGPCRHAGQARHHYGRRCEKDRSRSRHDPVRDRGRQVLVQARAGRHPHECGGPARPN